MAQTIEQTVGELRNTLIEYIEATYHISDDQLVRERNALLETAGDVYQSPYLESTPRYVKTKRYRDIEGIPEAALRLFEVLCEPVDGRKILHDPPYKHQAEAIKHVLIDGLSAVVMTGTGSGKTESFLLPILGKLAREAQTQPEVFHAQDGMRAMILYPMNALVNDQLGRLRGVFGDERLKGLFTGWASRPARFARYTSRTPYAGVRTKEADQRKLQPFKDFFVDLLTPQIDAEQAAKNSDLVSKLKEKGKWPAKPDLRAWYGAPKERWVDRQGNFVRAVTLPGDAELVTRHEVQASVPDLLITNYSMLEYMLMRPVEREIFDRTREWLSNNPKETFLLVLDEAHLYKGAAGAEVGLLIRRLRDRLGVSEDRFQVICATASFDKPEKAPAFGAKLSGVREDRFRAITGDIDERASAKTGVPSDVDILNKVRLRDFLQGDAGTRVTAVAPFLEFRGVAPTGNLERDLYVALEEYPPLGLLINKTMREALKISEIGSSIFPGADKERADIAATNLASMASAAKLNLEDPSLLPCRVHNFFRGLRGLWVCMDPSCSAAPQTTNRLCGKLFSQPMEICECGSRVLELFTCRYCGTAYARGYCEDVENPRTVWQAPGTQLRTELGDITPLLELDILLEEPKNPELAEIFDYDLVTGQLRPPAESERQRTVYLRANRHTPGKSDEEDSDATPDMPGAFQPCAGCKKSFQYGRSRIQDHETKGDQPFQVLLARQLAIQPPSDRPATAFAPLRGRKVLTFADSRQVAARLAPNIESYSRRDAIRPLIVLGMQRLSTLEAKHIPITLKDLYCGVLLAANKRNVRLRPEALASESLQGFKAVTEAFQNGAWESDDVLLPLCFQMRGETPPSAFFADMLSALLDPSLGLEPLAIGSLIESSDKRAAVIKLPNIADVGDTDEKKLALVRAWIRLWRWYGYGLPTMPQAWREAGPKEKWRIRSHAGNFQALGRFLNTAQKRAFETSWLPKLHELFTEKASGIKKHQFLGSSLSLQFEGAWVRCEACKSVHRPIPDIAQCQDCGATVAELIPDSNESFTARKGFYRNPIRSVIDDLEDAPTALIAAEHTAQLNAAEAEDVFSQAEQNELLFQDVELPDSADRSHPSAIDILSCTTTMEVGIDIGQLSGVALRNMPPGRSNYQQRSGRAGRRGNAIATVVAFGGSDTHDEHYFSHPEEMIRGKVGEPTLCLDNVEIVERHVHAFLLQTYHQVRLSAEAAAHHQNLFSVLGSVEDFQSNTATLNRLDFEQWLREHEATLMARVDSWIPRELTSEARSNLLHHMVEECLAAIDDALIDFPGPVEQKPKNVEQILEEAAPQTNIEIPAVHGAEADNLLSWLLYKGVLPRYAFPTDVAKFHVFDEAASAPFKTVVRYSPSQGLPIALSQYSPGKQVWIGGKCYVSGAIYSKFFKERADNFKKKKLHLECERCGYAFTREVGGDIAPGDLQDCIACGNKQAVGPARYWMRPAGFAHPVDIAEETSPDDVPEATFATRAKLEMQTPSEDSGWLVLNERTRVLTDRTMLLVTNSGPKKEGYRYCRSCGRVEASTEQHGVVFGSHRKPYPDSRAPICPGGNSTDHIVLGTNFESDVALFSFRFEEPVRMKADHSVTHAVLRTVCEALSNAATKILQIEPGDVQAEYRPAVTPAGVLGFEAEIFLYDTLPGGAGFSQQLAHRQAELFFEAREIMSSCEANCDASCYRCLRTFRNRLEHSSLDRHLGIAFIDYLLTGEIPHFEQKRMEASTHLLAEGLRREGWTGVEIHTEVQAKTKSGGNTTAPILVTMADGQKCVVALSFPMTQEHTDDTHLLNLTAEYGKSAILVDELLARKNLPAAVSAVASALGI